jgi:hypothetical protein
MTTATANEISSIQKDNNISLIHETLKTLQKDEESLFHLLDNHVMDKILSSIPNTILHLKETEGMKPWLEHIILTTEQIHGILKKPDEIRNTFDILKNNIPKNMLDYLNEFNQIEAEIDSNGMLHVTFIPSQCGTCKVIHCIDDLINSEENIFSPYQFEVCCQCDDIMCHKCSNMFNCQDGSQCHGKPICRHCNYVNSFFYKTKRECYFIDSFNDRTMCAQCIGIPAGEGEWIWNEGFTRYKMKYETIWRIPNFIKKSQSQSDDDDDDDDDDDTSNLQKKQKK